MNRQDILQQPLALPCGAQLKNRIAKSAMSEALATRDNRATPGLARLYGRWCDGGAGLIVSGNVMIDSHALVEPNVVAIDGEGQLAELTAWSSAGARNDTHVWMQLNHPGRVAPRGLNPGRESVAPSAIPLGADLARYFTPPRALTANEVEQLIVRFAEAASMARKAGFTGVQIHAAHGYLINQFLSPLSNQRTDHWGGSLENRTRFLVEVYRTIRTAVGPAFPVSVKLNSADFQKGGFPEEESIVVAEMLCGLGVDLLEISGGTYEAPAMQGQNMKTSTRLREAYFLDYAQKIRRRVRTPLMVTGGFRTADGMGLAINEGGTDVVGLARALAITPDIPKRIFAGEDFASPVKPIRTGIARVDASGMMEVIWYGRQLARMARGAEPKPDEHALYALVASLLGKTWQTWRSRRLRT